jgi:inosine-uridine nucleoside N-ribohydrolase
MADNGTATAPRRMVLDCDPGHDACAVAALLRPELLETRHLRVDVETATRFCDGRTVVDLWHVTGREPNVHVGFAMDAEAFIDLLLTSLASYPPAPPA